MNLCWIPDQQVDKLLFAEVIHTLQCFTSVHRYPLPSSSAAANSGSDGREKALNKHTKARLHSCGLTAHKESDACLVTNAGRISLNVRLRWIYLLFCPLACWGEDGNHTGRRLKRFGFGDSETSAWLWLKEASRLLSDRHKPLTCPPSTGKPQSRQVTWTWPCGSSLSPSSQWATGTFRPTPPAERQCASSLESW